MRERAGGAAVLRLRSIASVAECRGPRSEYRTCTSSSRDGLVRFEQRFADGRHALMGIDSQGAWDWDEWRGAARAAENEVVAFLRGHEFHWAGLHPETRFGPPGAASAARFDGRKVERVEFTDRLGAPVLLYVDAKTHTAAAVELSDPTGGGPVVARFSDWIEVDGVRVCRRVAIGHRGEQWEFRFTEIRIDSEADSSFVRPAPRSDREQLLALHESALRAHRRNDVAELLEPEAEDYLLANRGTISHPTRAEREANFEPYFARTRFTEYRDLVPPVVRISQDGTLGWVVVQVYVRGERAAATAGEQPEPLEFTCAWIELYEKRDGRWWRTGNLSNFKE